MLDPTGRRRDGNRNHERGQTTLDLAISTSLVLLITISVLATATQLTVPSGDERSTPPATSLTGDRIADHLVADLSADPGAERPLDREAVVAFFDGRDDRLGTELPGDHDRINVSVTDLDGGATVGERGLPIPDDRRTATSARAVQYNESAHWLSVVVW
ncbi:hypothetical protein OB905_12370 [Halobacteria archaeon AArc-dxtr1]|nr:hypothetical protein [Halobacteria archaeon AArc-dxtr1]